MGDDKKIPFADTSTGFFTNLGIETGTTALAGIFQARAAERARKQQLELQRDQGQLNVEMNKGQLQQQLLSGLSSSLSNIMMQRAASRAV
jgi:hypothetical protein